MAGGKRDEPGRQVKPVGLPKRFRKVFQDTPVLRDQLPAGRYGLSYDQSVERIPSPGQAVRFFYHAIKRQRTNRHAEIAPQNLQPLRGSNIHATYLLKQTHFQQNCRGDSQLPLIDKAKSR